MDREPLPAELEPAVMKLPSQIEPNCEERKTLPELLPLPLPVVVSALTITVPPDGAIIMMFPPEVLAAAVLMLPAISPEALALRTTEPARPAPRFLVEISERVVVPTIVPDRLEVAD